MVIPSFDGAKVTKIRKKTAIIGIVYEIKDDIRVFFRNFAVKYEERYEDYRLF
ncbi:MAG: hypothetical protein IJS97_03745 [Prevotella sp.]|nr:hypothetical protein [Prevotella sp.]